MGFYGNVVYQQIGNAILNLLINNSGKNNNLFLDKIPEDSSEIGKSTLSFGSGNKWIQLNSNGAGCDIWHSPANAAQTDSQVEMKVVESSGEEDNQLIAGVSCLSMPVFTYDEAGHVTSSSSVQYSMSNQFPKGIKILSSEKDKMSIEITKLENENTLVISFTE